MTVANTQKSNALPAAAPPPPSEMAYCVQLHASEGKAEAQLGDSAATAMSLGGAVVAIPIKSPVLHIYRANEKPLTKCD